MCARYTLTASPDTVAAAFGLTDTPDLFTRCNVAPSQLVAVVGLKPGGTKRGLALLRWGFVPRWAKDPNAGPKPVNAQAETVATKAPFRDRRCLIPADGFFVWSAEGGKKVAHHFRKKSGQPFAFAGVWDAWKGAGKDTILSCALLTVPANDVVRPLHDRMPAILSVDQYVGWLDPRTPVEELMGMLAPYPAGQMEAVRVGPAVNKVANDGPACLTPAA